MLINLIDKKLHSFKKNSWNLRLDSQTFLKLYNERVGERGSKIDLTRFPLFYYFHYIHMYKERIVFQFPINLSFLKSDKYFIMCIINFHFQSLFWVYPYDHVKNFPIKKTKHFWRNMPCHRSWPRYRPGHILTYGSTR